MMCLMAIEDKIQQEQLNYIRLEHFITVLKYSLAGSSADAFDTFFSLLDKGLNLWFTESGYIFDEQKAFNGDVKCAMIRIKKAREKLEYDDPKLFKREIVKTQDDYDVSVGDLLVNKEEVEKAYALFGEEQYPWALVLWPLENSDWQWFPVHHQNDDEFEVYFEKFASIDDLERERRELELLNPVSLSEHEYKATAVNRINQEIKRREDEAGITEDRLNWNQYLDSSITPLDKITEHQYQSWSNEKFWPQSEAIKRVISSQNISFLDKRTAALDLLALVNHTRHEHDGLLDDVEENYEIDTEYVSSQSWLTWCIDNGFYPGIKLFDAVFSFTKVDKNRKRRCQIAELEWQKIEWENRPAKGLIELQIKEDKIIELEQQVKDLKSFKREKVDIDSVDYQRKPDASDQYFLSILSIAENWAIETQQKPSEKLRQLAFAVLQWVQTPKKLQKAYRKSGDPKFLEASYLEAQKSEIESGLKKIGLLNGDLLEDDLDVLRSIDIFQEAFKDWIQRNQFKQPQFWLSDKVQNVENKAGDATKAVKTKKPDSASSKRLSDLKEFIDLLIKVADVKNIELDVFNLPCSKQMLLDELKKRHQHKNHWKIKIASFEQDWKLEERRSICGVVPSSKQMDENFFKKFF